MSNIIRKVNLKKDLKHIQRIWHEVGWVGHDEFKYLDDWVKNSNGLVAEVNGQAECYVSSLLGDFKYQQNTLPFSAITAVTTSFIARKQGLAGKMTALQIANDALSGAKISGLSMFEQGFYNQLGYGNGTYEYLIEFSPSTLVINQPFRTPERLTKKHYKEIHESRLHRLRKHGSCVLPISNTRFAVSCGSKKFGLGYRDENNNLTHHIWLNGLGSEDGPLYVRWLNYQNYNQFIELMALIKSLGDQIKLISMIEPPDIFIQDILKKPFFHRYLSKNSKFMNQNKSFSFSQFRILDLFRCIEITTLEIKEFSFNLKLSDPIESYLDSSSEWQGISGEYIITLGQNSFCENGKNKKLDTLHTTVNGFTRMWAGVLPASSLIISEDFSANENLIQKLDYAFASLPKPHPDWDF